jgi:hypothetical protein
MFVVWVPPETLRQGRQWQIAWGRVSRVMELEKRRKLPA